MLLFSASAQMWLRKQSATGEFHVHNSGVVSSVATETEFSTTVKTQYGDKYTRVSFP